MSIWGLSTAWGLALIPHQLLVVEGKSAPSFLEQLEMGATPPSVLA